MDQAKIEARVEKLFKEAKPRSRKKKGYFKLAAALILAAIPLSITQQPGSSPTPEPPIIQATAEAQAPTITPSVLDDTDKTLTITVDQPGTVFFCGCPHSHKKIINPFTNATKSSDI